MSRVYVLAAGKELPLCDRQEFRTSESGGYVITLLRGFRVAQLNYYRQAVEELDCPMKPFRYEIELEKDGRDLENLRAYLRQNFSQGERLELWNLWVGDTAVKCPPRFRGSLADFDMEALEQFLAAEEACFEITI